MARIRLLSGIYDEEFIDEVQAKVKEDINKKPKYRITKCYMIEHIDDEGNQLSEAEYIFGSKKDALEYIHWKDGGIEYKKNGRKM